MLYYWFCGPAFADIGVGETASGTTVLLARHRQTDWNALDLLQGWADVTLNHVGLREVGGLGASWEEEVGLDVDVIYSAR